MHALPERRHTDARTDYDALPGMGWTVSMPVHPAPAVPHTRLPRARAQALLRHSGNPSAYLALNEDTCHFTVPGFDGFIPYRQHGRFLFQLGGCFGAPAARGPLLEGFRWFARQQQCRICAVQLQEEDIALYQSHGFSINQMGTAYTIDVRHFSPMGSRFAKLRNKVSQARRAGISVVELGVDAPRSDQDWLALASISRAWLAARGGQARLAGFMVGETGQPGDLERRVFVAQRAGRAVGFISFVPVHGARPGLLHDLARRAPDAPPGVMDLVNLTAIARFQREGIAHLHFGLAPFAGLNAQRDCVAGRNWLLGQLARTIYRHGAFLYPARQQEHYQRKWHPHYAQPEYVGFEGGVSLAGLGRLVQLASRA